MATSPILARSDQADSDIDFYHMLGFAAAMAIRSDRYCQYPIACLALWIEPPILLNQIHFFRDRSGNLIGYLTWALLAEDAESRLIHDPEVLFHFSEWNEGDRLWIMDLVLTEGSLREVVKEVISLFPHFHMAKSLRRDDDGAVRKITTWRRRK